MNAHRISARQLGSLNSRALATILAAGGFGVMAMLALNPVGTGEASSQYTPPAAQVAPDAHQSVGYFPDRFGPVKGEIDAPIEQF